MAEPKYKQFGEWLKLRRLAGELTPLDLAKYLGIELATYREIELGQQGMTQALIERLTKLEKLKVTMRDMRGRAPLVADADGPQLIPPPATTPKPTSPLDAIIASAAASQQRADTKNLAANRPTRLAEVLASDRLRTGASRLEQARACKLTPGLWEDIDAGFTPGLAVLRKIAEGLGLPVEAITETAPQDANRE
jgi:transcriptional regulator with XRE-family HTH domain